MVALAAAVLHSETKLQKSAKIPVENFEYEGKKSNRKLWLSAETYLEISWNHIRLNLDGFKPFETTVRRRLAWRGAAGCYTKQLGTTTKEVSQTCDLTLDG